MSIHKAKQINIIQFTGDEPRIVRELLTNPLPMVKNGDLLIVPEKVAKFLSRPGSPFEMFNGESLEADTENEFVSQISDDAVAKVTALNKIILELENELKIKIDELEGYELRENQEMEELKKLNQELNDKLESKPKATRTTKATKEEIS